MKIVFDRVRYLDVVFLVGGIWGDCGFWEMEYCWRKYVIEGGF